MKNRLVLAAFSCATAYLPTMTLAQQSVAAYPTKAVRVVVSTSAGGMTDVVARLYAEYLTTHLKQPFVVENMPGASTMLASRHVAKAVPDGYTLLVAANSIAAMPHMVPAAGYQLNDFSAVGEMGQAPSLLVVSGDSAYKSLPALIEHAKKSPGGVTYAFSGHGTTSHVTAELFAKSAHLDLRSVPYKGISLAVPDVAANRVDFMMGPATSSAEMIRAGKMRALAITSAVRAPAFPDVPTFQEAGYKDLTYNLSFGLVAPSGLPQAIRDKISSAMEDAKRDQAFVARLKGMGLELSDIRSSQQYETYLKEEDRKSRNLVAQDKSPTVK